MTRLRLLRVFELSNSAGIVGERCVFFLSLFLFFFVLLFLFLFFERTAILDEVVSELNLQGKTGPVCICFSSRRAQAT